MIFLHMKVLGRFQLNSFKWNTVHRYTYIHISIYAWHVRESYYKCMTMIFVFLFADYINKKNSFGT